MTFTWAPFLDPLCGLRHSQEISKGCWQRPFADGVDSQNNSLSSFLLLAITIILKENASVVPLNQVCTILEGECSAFGIFLKANGPWSF
jgi:hypothetical protein